MRLIYTLSLLITISSLSAQPNLGTWQWAQQGGGVFNTSNNENEVVNDMCTDKYGNVYITGAVYQDPYFGGIRYIAPFASFGGEDAFVAKYDKCGNFKWARFGGSTQEDKAVAIHVDDSLNVYITGFAGPISNFPDSTHTLGLFSNGYGSGLFWAKYDSVGDIKWVYGTSNHTGVPSAPSKLIARPDGNLSIVVSTDTGTFYAGSNLNNAPPGDAILEFDLNGNPVSLYSIDSVSLTATYSFLNFGDIAYDSKGNIVMIYSIFDTAKVFDTTLYTPSGNQRTFLLKADYATHKLIWIKEWKEDQYEQSGFASVLVDNNDDIIADGSGGRGGIFNSDTIKFNSTPNYSMGICFKFDSNGNTLWYDVADNTNNSNTAVIVGPMSLYSDQYICIGIVVFGPTYWGGDTLNSYGTNWQNWTSPQFISFINTNNGTVIYGDSIAESNALTTSPTKIISDKQGNVYVGGYFSAGLIAGPDTIYNRGGINDAFVLKWGVPCAEDSTSLIPPLAALDLVAYASGLHAIDVNWQNVTQYADKYRIYRSATDSTTGYSLIDSVSNSTTLYTDVNVVTNQIYWYRVSAVNGAGETFSNSDSAVIIPNGIADLSADIKSIALYPNPAANYTKLSVRSNVSAPAMISIADVEGRVYYSKETTINQGKNDFIIDISGISAGVYVVNMASGNGIYSKRLVVIK